MTVTTSNYVTTCPIGAGRRRKKLCIAFSLGHIYFSKNLVCSTYTKF